MEVLEPGAGLDAELLDERRASGAVRSERIGLPPRPVEREHQLPVEPLPERLLIDQRLELRDEVAMASEEEIGVDALFERSLAQLLEPADLGLGERLVGEIGERRPAPQAERFPKIVAAVSSSRIERAARASNSRCSKRAVSTVTSPSTA